MTFGWMRRHDKEVLNIWWKKRCWSQALPSTANIPSLLPCSLLLKNFKMRPRSKPRRIISPISAPHFHFSPYPYHAFRVPRLTTSWTSPVLISILYCRVSYQMRLVHGNGSDSGLRFFQDDAASKVKFGFLDSRISKLAF